jgi:hypothetical protein
MSTAILSEAAAVRFRCASAACRAVLLDRELDVLHVAVVALQRLAHAHQLGVGGGHRALHAALVRLGAASLIGCGVRMPATTSSPWALMRYSP